MAQPGLVALAGTAHLMAALSWLVELDSAGSPVILVLGAAVVRAGTPGWTPVPQEGAAILQDALQAERQWHIALQGTATWQR